MTAASPSPSCFAKLPEFIGGERINLETFTPLAWPSVRATTKTEKQEISDILGMGNRGVKEFSSAKAYEFVCHVTRSAEAWNDLPNYPPQRCYWMTDHAANQVVGITIVVNAPSVEKGLMIGYHVLSNHRNRGYASDAAQSISEAILQSKAASFVCAEVPPDNLFSVHALRNAGFRHVGQGICSTPCEQLGEPVLCFLKTGQNSGNPPKWPVCSRT